MWDTLDASNVKQWHHQSVKPTNQLNLISDLVVLIFCNPTYRFVFTDHWPTMISHETNLASYPPISIGFGAAEEHMGLGSDSTIR